MSTFRRALFALPLVLGLPSVAYAGHRPPPAARVVHVARPVVAAPARRWVAGHWDFRGTWVWVPGAYVALAPPVVAAPTVVVRL